MTAMSAGAYGFTIAPNYNTRPIPAEILADGDTSHGVIMPMDVHVPLAWRRSTYFSRALAITSSCGMSFAAPSRMDSMRR